MKKLHTTIAMLLIYSLAFSQDSTQQRVMIEAGPIFFKGYGHGINVGTTVIVTPKAKSGFGFGVELYKTGELPVGIPIFIRGILRSDKGPIVSMQVGYMFMHSNYDEGGNIGGIWTKLGVGMQFKKIGYVLANFTATQIYKEFQPGGNFMIGIRF